MDKNIKKEYLVNIITHINEIMSQTEVTLYFKNPHSHPIELEMVIPQLGNCTIIKFEMIKNNKRIVSKLLEKEIAREKYNDTISTGDSSLISYNSNFETKICLGNISSGEQVELKLYYFGHIINKDLSYQANIPIKFPDFILEDPKSRNEPEDYVYLKRTVKGKIYINTRSKITRLVIGGSKNFTKIERKYGEDKKSAEIDIYKDYFSNKDIPGIILFRTEKINDDALYYQCDQRKNKSYYLLQKTIYKPEFDELQNDLIDEDENKDYISLVRTKENEEEIASKVCYIFLLDQSGSMEGESIELSCKALLLFLQSLSEDCYFQLVGFGSDFEFFTAKPLEYNKNNIKKLMKTIKNLRADKGGTVLTRPLEAIYNNKLYNKFEGKTNIILLTDGYVDSKERVLDLIGANSKYFIFHSIGITQCDKDLIERAALIGNGYSYYISNLEQLNFTVISLFDNTQNNFYVQCTTNQKCSIEEENKKSINKNDFFSHGFVLDDINMKDIEFNIKIGEKEIKISFDKDKIIKLPDGDNLGKLIVDNYLKSSIHKNLETIIKLSKEYNILTDQTAYYAKITNLAPVKDKMIKITNKDKIASNNKIEDEVKPQNIIKENNDNYFNDEMFGYDNEEKEEEKPEEKKNFIFGFFSKFFNNDNIIKKKKFSYTQTPQKLSKKKEDIQKRAAADYESCVPKESGVGDFDYGCENTYGGYYISSIDDDYDNSYGFSNFDIQPKKSNKKTIEDNSKFNFDEFIIHQDIIEGNWIKDDQSDFLIEQEKDMYEQIKKLCEDKGIKEESGIITLFALYYIYNKKCDKLGELKFIVKKAKNYLRKSFNIEYDAIIKDIEKK